MPEQTEVIEVGKIQRLHIEPGETLVITLPSHTTAAELERISAIVKERLPDGTEVLFVAGDVELSVVASRQMADHQAPMRATPQQAAAARRKDRR